MKAALWLGLAACMHTCIVSFTCGGRHPSAKEGSFNGSILPNRSGLMLERLMSCEKGWREGREWG